MRAKTTKTRYPGVYSVDGTSGKFRVWGQVTNPKTGKKETVDKLIDAKSAKHADSKLNELLEKKRKHQPKPGGRKTLDQYAKSWLRSKLPKLKASTRSHYTSMLDEHILPVLGAFYLDAIERDDLLDWREAMLAKQLIDPKGQPMFRNGEPRLPTAITVNGRWRVLKQLIQDAVASEKLDRDPTSRIEALRETVVQSDEDEDEEDNGKSITAKELGALLDQARVLTPTWYPFFYVLAFTGVRFGEISALKWRDVNETTGRIWIRRSQWKGIVDTVKNKKPRTVPLMPELHDVLEEHRVAQRDRFVKRMQRQRMPDISQANPGDWVFPSRQTKLIDGVRHQILLHNTAPRKPLTKALEAAGIKEHFTVHGFRHTFNNLVRQVAEMQGQSVVLQAMTGHSSDEMTEHYSHVSIDEKRKAVGGLLRLVREG